MKLYRWDDAHIPTTFAIHEEEMDRHVDLLSSIAWVAGEAENACDGSFNDHVAGISTYKIKDGLYVIISKTWPDESLWMCVDELPSNDELETIRALYQTGELL